MSETERDEMITGLRTELRYDLRISLERSLLAALEAVAVARHERRALISEANDAAHIANPESSAADRFLAQSADSLHAAIALIHLTHRGIGRGPAA